MSEEAKADGETSKVSPECPTELVDIASLGISAGDPLGDSGAGWHIVGKDTIKKLVEDFQYTVSYFDGIPVSLITGNGIKSQVKRRAKIFIPQVNMDLEFLVLDSCPLAISLGRLLRDNSWDLFLSLIHISEPTRP